MTGSTLKLRAVGFSALIMVTALAPLSAQEAKQYAYDALGRLVTVDVGGGPRDGTGREYALDDAGNRTEVAAATNGVGSTACSLRAADVTVVDTMQANVYIYPTPPCSHNITLSYKVTQLSGQGSFVDSGFGNGSGFVAAGSTYKRMIITPVAGSVPAGQELVLRVQFTTQTDDTEFQLSSSIVTIKSSQ